MTMNFTRPLRYLTALCLAALAGSASANCLITRFTSSGDVMQVFKEHDGRYDFADYDVVCNKLRKANAQIIISGSYGVLSNRSFGWASISIADKADNHFVVTDYGKRSTSMHDFASDDIARKQLWIAINYALNTWDGEGLDQAITTLNQARQARRKAIAK